MSWMMIVKSSSSLKVICYLLTYTFFSNDTQESRRLTRSSFALRSGPSHMVVSTTPFFPCSYSISCQSPLSQWCTRDCALSYARERCDALRRRSYPIFATDCSGGQDGPTCFLSPLHSSSAFLGAYNSKKGYNLSNLTFSF